MAEKITDRLAKELEAPSEGNRKTYDTEIKGFGIRVTAAGAKAFILNYRTLQGRERRYTIGSYPDWTVAAAREKAKALKREIDQGKDPMGSRHDERAAPTVEDLAARYLTEHAVKKRESSRREDKAMLDKIIVPRLGKLKVAAVAYSDIEGLHRKVTERAPYRANRILALLSKMFGLAIRHKMRPDNPCKGIERNQEQRRNRYLSSEELGRLTMALAEHPSRPVANAVRLLLLTGARRGEVLGATWDQFDLETGVWIKPGATTKQKTEHRVPLSAPALQLLVEMRAEAEAAAEKMGIPVSPYVFPGDGKQARLTDIKKGWAAIRKAADIGDCRLHDLRHSYASILASAGLSLPIIGRLLGHTQPGTTARYAHLYDDPLRQATERVGAIVEAARTGHSAKILDLASGKRGSK